MKWLLLLLCVLSLPSHSGNFLDEHLETLNWNGIKVVWIKDDKLPTYNVAFYFNEGASGDKKLSGLTDMMFQQLGSGTKRYTRHEISEALGFFGVDYGPQITHDYSVYTVSGLVKDFIPTMKMVCHMFENSIFPQKELKKEKRRAQSELKGIVVDHGSLAHRVFRYESLKGSGYEAPVGGTLKTIKKISSQNLKDRLTYFNQKVEKRIYLRGPKSVVKLAQIISQDCKWSGGDHTVKKKVPEVKKAGSVKKMIFVPIKKANQAQVILGRTLLTNEVDQNSDVIKNLVSDFLGGGFNSKLIKKLRIEKGFVYSASAHVSDQKKYGRALIMTSTRNEAVVELLKSIQQVIKEASHEIKEKNLDIVKKMLKGSYLMQLESSYGFLRKLLFFDYVGKDYKEIYMSSKKIDNLSAQDIQVMVDKIFNWDKQLILILGNKSLIKDLRKAGYQLEIKNYRDYL